MLPDRLVDMKLLPSPGRALVTSSKLEKPGSEPGPKAERMIWRCTSRNSSEMRVRVRDQSSMPARSRDLTSIEDGPCKVVAGSEINPHRGTPELRSVARSGAAIRIVAWPGTPTCSPIDG